MRVYKGKTDTAITVLMVLVTIDFTIAPLVGKVPAVLCPSRM